MATPPARFCHSSSAVTGTLRALASALSVVRDGSCFPASSLFTYSRVNPARFAKAAWLIFFVTRSRLSRLPICLGVGVIVNDHSPNVKTDHRQPGRARSQLGRGSAAQYGTAGSQR